MVEIVDSPMTEGKVILNGKELLKAEIIDELKHTVGVLLDEIHELERRKRVLERSIDQLVWDERKKRSTNSMLEDYQKAVEKLAVMHRKIQRERR